MDKSYIIRVYKHENEAASGIVEDVEESKRTKFCDAEQLWSLITSHPKEDEFSNVVSLKEKLI